MRIWRAEIGVGCLSQLLVSLLAYWQEVLWFTSNDWPASSGILLSPPPQPWDYRVTQSHELCLST